jgi:purine-binding chemotaxis protein CheW
MSAPGPQTMQVAAFRLDGRLFGVDIRLVKEITEETRLVPIPRAPEGIAGMLNIRGRIHLVVDLRTAFRFPSSSRDSHSRVILFKPSVDEPFGVLVDAVEDILEIDPDRMVDRRSPNGPSDPAHELRRARRDLCLGVYPLPRELLLVLNPHSILET